MTKTDRALRAEDIDQLAQALISLTKELWLVKDRQRILEAALNDAGLIEPGAIDRYQPDDDLRRELESERRRLIDGLIRDLTEAEH